MNLAEVAVAGQLAGMAEIASRPLPGACLQHSFLSANSIPNHPAFFRRKGSLPLKPLQLKQKIIYF
jgi:hypothetical protein